MKNCFKDWSQSRIVPTSYHGTENSSCSYSLNSQSWQGKKTIQKIALEILVEEPGFKNVKNKHLGMSPF